MRWHRRRPIVLCVLAVAVCVPAIAAVDVHVSLDREIITLGETAELTVAVSGALLGVEPPRIPQIDYLHVVSSSSRNTVQFTNGRSESTAVFIYGLRPSREGTYTIPSMNVQVGDELYTTHALTLRVMPGTTSIPSPGGQPTAPPTTSPGTPQQEISAVTTADNPNPFVGEQVTLTLRFLQAHTARLVGNAEYEPPPTEGLVAEPLPDDPQRTEVINGIPYEIVTRKTALIAPSPGKYTIGPATITFRRGFMSDEETIKTDPITLNVRALPSAGRPQGFTGAVGSLQLTMTPPAEQVRVGEAAPLRLQITGTGDLRQLQPPDVAVDGDARIYQSGEERQISPQIGPGGAQVGGAVTFDYLIMPLAAGQLTIKPIVMYYFDPRTERYRSAQTTTATIEVVPGEAIAHPAESKLAYIKEDGLALRARQPVTSTAWFWAVQAMPVACIGLALRERAERARRLRDPRYRRRVEAARHARAALHATSNSDHPAEVFRRTDEALAEYIAARTDASAAALSPEAARDRLLAAGVGEELASRAEELLHRTRAGAYAPGASGAPAPAQVLIDARALVDALEEALR